MTLLVQQLSHRYGEVEALRNVSAAAASGKITAVLGPNASGKSTLLRCAIGAISPTSGAVLIDGKPAHAMSAYRLAQKVAYVPQRSVVSAAFTVREVVELGRYALPANRARIDEAIERLELKAIEDRPYPALSVGQQQRVTLARAVAQLELGRSIRQQVNTRNSELGTRNCSSHLILDEPTSAMDLRHVRDCARLLREIADAGATILIAMHDLALATAMVDEAWLLHEGRLVAAGTVSDVMTVERLREVYGVEFAWVSGPGGRPSLLAAPPVAMRNG